MEQMAFGFLQELDQKIAAEEERLKADWQRKNDIAILRSCVQQYPLTDYERRVIPKGVRPSRFVIDRECRGCPYSYLDHTLGYRFGVDDSEPHRQHVPKVCLKDWIRKGYGKEEEIMAKEGGDQWQQKSSR